MCLKSLRAHKNCTIALGILAFIFIILGIILPIVLHKAIVDMAKDSTLMTPGTYNLWGQVPGDSKMVIYRTFQFYNFTNPYEAIFLNETPIMQESNYYDYQEYQQFLNYSFSTLPNTSLEVVTFNFWNYMKKLHRGNASDMMKVVNLAAFGSWYQLQTSEKFLLSIQTMSQMIVGIETEIVDYAEAQGVSSMFFASKDDAFLLFESIGLSTTKSNELWEDSVFGWKNTSTFVNWIQAAKQGLYNKTSKMIKDYFHLTYTQMSPLLESLQPNIDAVSKILNNIYCANKTNLTCDSKYLAALQWSQQGVTLNPPGGIGAAKSIISTNTTADGFPEISYFYTDYFLKNVSNSSEYQNITFDVDWAYNLLARSGDPKNWLKSPHLMLHQGNLKFLFSQGAIFESSQNLKDLEPIKERFLLKDLYQTHVFWKYMDYMVVEFALMSSKNGTRETLGLGAFSAQYFYSEFAKLKDFLLNDITAKSLLANLTQCNFSCSELFNKSMEDVNSSQLDSICNKDPNLKKLDENSMLFLSDLCLNQYDPIWMNFMKSNSLNKKQMLELCAPDYGYLGPLILNTSRYIKTFYNCKEDADYCSANEIALKQWGSSQITLNPLPFLNGRYYNASFSVSEWNSSLFPKPIEFLGFLNITQLNRSKIVIPTDRKGINETISAQLLTFDCLFNAVMNNKVFVFYLNNDLKNFTKNFPVENPLLLLNYLRYVTLEFGFGGIVVQKNVSDLLLGYEVPFIKTMRDTDPAMGGNPSINPVVGFCPNSTAEDALFNKQVMYTGRGDVNKIRTYHTVLDSQNIVLRTPDFDGNETRNITKNPYNEIVPIKGTDAFTNRPNLDPSGDSFNVFVTMLFRYGTTSGKSDTRDFNGLTGYLYRMNNDLMNKNPVFNQNKWNGFLNFSSIMSAPVFNSKRHFLDADSEILSFIKLIDADGKNITPNRDQDDIYLYVEPYTGLSLSAWLKLQTSVELSKNLLFNSTYAMLPIFTILRGGDIPDSTVDDLLGQLKLGILFENVVSRAICFGIGGILLIVFIVLGCKYISKIKKNQKETLLPKEKEEI